MYLKVIKTFILITQIWNDVLYMLKMGNFSPFLGGS